MSSRCVSSCDNRRSSISDSFSSCRNNTTFLPHLELGDVGTSLDMTIEPNMYKALKKANFLLAHDFAFVLRSNGQWTYAMVAHRGPIGTSDGEEDALLFVLDMKGSTKKLSRKHWSSCIRMVNTNALSNSYICWSHTHTNRYAMKNNPGVWRVDWTIFRCTHVATCRAWYYSMHFPQKWNFWKETPKIRPTFWSEPQFKQICRRRRR